MKGTGYWSAWCIGLVVALVLVPLAGGSQESTESAQNQAEGEKLLVLVGELDGSTSNNEAQGDQLQQPRRVTAKAAETKPVKPKKSANAQPKGTKGADKMMGKKESKQAQKEREKREKKERKEREKLEKTARESENVGRKIDEDEGLNNEKRKKKKIKEVPVDTKQQKQNTKGSKRDDMAAHLSGEVISSDPEGSPRYNRIERIPLARHFDDGGPSVERFADVAA
mgnify:FL=1